MWSTTLMSSWIQCKSRRSTLKVQSMRGLNDSCIERDRIWMYSETTFANSRCRLLVHNRQITASQLMAGQMANHASKSREKRDSTQLQGHYTQPCKGFCWRECLCLYRDDVTELCRSRISHKASTRPSCTWEWYQRTTNKAVQLHPSLMVTIIIPDSTQGNQALQDYHTRAVAI